MSWLYGLRERVRFVVRRRQVEREMAEELAFHHEREVDRHLDRGLSRAEAERAARASFGWRNTHLEGSRDEWSGAFAGVGQDVRLALRRLVAQPGFAVVALLTLALGIGANTAIFSLVRGVLLEPLPYPEPDRLVMVWESDRGQETWVSAREILEYDRGTTSFELLGGYTDFNANLTEGEPERVLAAAATAEALEVLGARAIQGRVFTGEEDAPGRDGVVLLGHDIWERRFGGSPDVVGSTIRVNGVARTVLGVLPPEFRMPLDFRKGARTDLLVPLAIDESRELPWGDRGNYIVARLKRGVSAEEATADMQAAFHRWLNAGLFRDEDGRDTRRAFPLDDLLLGGVRPALLVLFGAVAFILLIACANVAHLLLARADARRREVAMQAALGASRLRIARALLTESAVLAGLGALLGIGFAHLGLRIALAAIPVSVVRTKGVELDWGVLAFAALLSLLTALLAGLAPAIQLAAVRLRSVTDAARGEGAPVRRGVRRSLVGLETALSLVLVVGAALLAKSFVELRRVELGFDPSSVLTARLALPQADYPAADQVSAFYERLIERVEALPGVQSAAAVRVLPLATAIGNWSITVEGRQAQPGENFNGDWQIVSPGYFETMRVQLATGRFLTDADRAGAPLVALVSEAMARAYWPGESALGKRFHLGSLDQPWITVVGVVRGVRHNAVTEASRNEMYLPHSQWPQMRGDGAPQRGMALVVRTLRDPLALAAAVREQVRALDPSLPIAEVRTMDEITAEALAEPRFSAVMLGGFALLALLLAAVGLYGVISYSAARRTRELGIRLALGAGRANVVGLVIGEGLLAAGAGIVVGLLASLWLTRLLEGQLYGVAPLDRGVFMMVPLALLGVAALASYLPARRASRVNPVVALRAE